MPAVLSKLVKEHPVHHILDLLYEDEIVQNCVTALLEIEISSLPDEECQHTQVLMYQYIEQRVYMPAYASALFLDLCIHCNPASLSFLQIQNLVVQKQLPVSTPMILYAVYIYWYIYIYMYVYKKQLIQTPRYIDNVYWSVCVYGYIYIYND